MVGAGIRGPRPFLFLLPLFTNVVEVEFSEVRMLRILGSPLRNVPPYVLAALWLAQEGGISMARLSDSPDSEAMIVAA
jgi:hypothetical protein